MPCAPTYALIVWAIAIALLALPSITHAQTDAEWEEEPGAPLAVFREAWQILHQDYLDSSVLDSRRLAFEAARGAAGALGGPGAARRADDADARRLTHAAIRTMVDSLGDPNTRFLAPEERRVETAGYSGSLEGVGACVALRAGRVSVDAVVVGSPAERAGVRAGDRLRAVDGRALGGLPVEEVVLRARGAAGTSVALTVERADGELTELRLEREAIRLVSAWVEPLDAAVGLLRIVAFTEHTDGEVAAGLDELARRGVRGLVLDLRGNPGGLLEPAIGVASRFVASDPLAWREDRRGGRTPYTRPPERSAVGWPLAALVDGRTASAAEVLAAALRDARRAPLVGQRTYGKGTVQYLYDLSDGSGLHVTAARWLSPAGAPLDHGITPDVPVTEAPSAERDPALEEATRILLRALGDPTAPATAPTHARHDCGPNSPNAL